MRLEESFLRHRPPLKIIYLMDVLSACVPVHCLWCLHRPEVDIRLLGTEVTAVSCHEGAGN